MGGGVLLLDQAGPLHWWTFLHSLWLTISRVCCQVGRNFPRLLHPQKWSPAQGGDDHRDMRAEDTKKWNNGFRLPFFPSIWCQVFSTLFQPSAKGHIIQPFEESQNLQAGISLGDKDRLLRGSNKWSADVFWVCNNWPWNQVLRVGNVLTHFLSHQGWKLRAVVTSTLRYLVPYLNVNGQAVLSSSL